MSWVRCPTHCTLSFFSWRVMQLVGQGSVWRFLSWPLLWPVCQVDRDQARGCIGQKASQVLRLPLPLPLPTFPHMSTPFAWHTGSSYDDPMTGGDSQDEQPSSEDYARPFDDPVDFDMTPSGEEPSGLITIGTGNLQIDGLPCVRTTLEHHLPRLILRVGLPQLSTHLSSICPE